MPTEEYDDRRNTSHRIEILSKVVPTDEQLRILDVGAGTGWFARWASKLGHRVTAVDPDLAPIPGVKVINERWQQDRLLPEWDMIVGLSVLHHVDEWRNFIDRALTCAPVVVFEPCDRNESRPHVLNWERSPLIYDYLIARGLLEIGWSESAFGGLRPVMVYGVDVGSVCAGGGFSTIEWELIGSRVSEEYRRALRPGTLNVWNLAGTRNVPYKARRINTASGTLTAWEATLNGFPVLEVIMPIGSIFVREFMSEYNLRERLGLRDGDRVVIK